MMQLEDKIMAYLDGTLDEHDRSALMHELSVDPAKRRLLEEHIKVREIISLGHKPQAVPLQAEHKLAARVPVLMQELPYLSNTVARTAPSLLASALSGVRSALHGITSRWTPGIGVATALVVGSLTYLTLNDTRETHDDVATTRVRSTPPAFVEPPSGSVSAPGSLSTSGSANSLFSAKPHASKDQVIRSSEEHVSIVNNDGAFKESVQNVPIDESSDRSTSTIERPSTPDDPNSVENTKQPEHTTPAKVGEERTLPTLPSQPARSVTGRILTHFEVSEGFNFSPDQQTRSYEPRSAMLGIVGATYQLTDHIAVGIEGGKSTLSQQRTETRKPTPAPQMAPMNEWSSLDRRIEYTRIYTERDALWSLAIMRYTFNPIDKIRVEATGGAGAAFVEGIAPMVALGLSGSYDVMSRVAITGGVSARGAWLGGLESVETPPQASPGEAIGIVKGNKDAATVFTPSIGVRVGLRLSVL